MSPARHPQRGVAAVEFAILLTLLTVLLAAPLFIGRVLWHYTVIEKAAHDAVRYLSTVPEAEMRTQSLAPLAADLAELIIQAELADLNTGSEPPLVTVKCNGNACGGNVAWSTVAVHIEAEMHDPFFGNAFGGENGIVLSSDASMNYIGTR